MLMTFAQNLKYVMERDNLTMYRVSKLTGFSQTTIKNWVSGKTEPYEKDKIAIATALNVSYFDLFGADLQQEEKKKGSPFIVNSKPVEFDIQIDDGLTDKQRDLINLVAELPDNVVSLLLSAAKDWLKNQQSSDSV